MTDAILEISLAKRDLTNHEKMQFDSSYAARRRDPDTALILSILLGGLGVDRFYVGDTGLGVVKLCTLGAFGVWTLIDWFKIRKVAREKNQVAAREIHDILLQLRPDS